MSKTLAIFGAGPAGCALAAALFQQGFSGHIYLITRPLNRRASVGESLAPTCREQLNQLGLTLTESDHQTYLGNCSLWGSDQPQFKDFTLNRTGGWRIDRSRFDHSLQTQVCAMGAEQIPDATLHTLAWQDNQWHLNLRLSPSSDSSIPRTIKADFIVDASGRKSSVASRLGIRKQRYDQQVALVANLPETHPADDVHYRDLLTRYALIEAGKKGWWYSARIPGQQQVLALMTDRSLVQSEQLKQTDHLRSLLKQSQLVNQLSGELPAETEFQVYPAMSECLNQVCGYGWMAIGDAAVGMDPLTSSGITSALDDALFTAELILNWLTTQHSAPLKHYSQRMNQAFHRYLLQKQYFYCQEQRWPEEHYWQLRHNLHQPQSTGHSS